MNFKQQFEEIEPKFEDFKDEIFTYEYYVIKQLLDLLFVDIKTSNNDELVNIIYYLFTHNENFHKFLIHKKSFLFVRKKIINLFKKLYIENKKISLIEKIFNLKNYQKKCKMYLKFLQKFGNSLVRKNINISEIFTKKFLDNINVQDNPRSQLIIHRNLLESIIDNTVDPSQLTPFRTEFYDLIKRKYLNIESFDAEIFLNKYMNSEDFIEFIEKAREK